MIYSMTGYGEAVHDCETIRAGFRIRTVNNKGLDINLKLPFDLMYLEVELRDLLRGHFFRGRVDVFSEIEIRDPEAAPPNPLNRSKLAQLLDVANQIKSGFGVGGELDINSLIRTPDLMTTQRVGFRLPPQLEKIVHQTLLKAVEEVTRSRLLEGGKLCEDFLERLTTARKDVLGIEELAVQRQEQIKQQILRRVHLLMSEVNLEEGRLNQELIYYADRLDITEELTRLKAHLGTTETMIHADKRPKGKRLDFMIQEQFREVTTIGNKAKHKEIADLVVKLKTTYEKLREQILNVE